MVHQTNTAVRELRLILDDEPSHLTIVHVALTTSHSLSSLWLVLVERRITLIVESPCSHPMMIILAAAFDGHSPRQALEDVSSYTFIITNHQRHHSSLHKF